MSSDRQTAVARLRNLPPLFSLHDARVQGLSPGTERNALSRWKAAGLVDAVGPKLGWYYNLIADHRGRDEHLGSAIRAVFGSAVLIGPSALHNNHWTPQPPQVVTVAVPLSRSYPQIEGAIVYGRPSEWFIAVVGAVRAQGIGAYKLPQLPPEYALADMLSHGDSLHGLKPDDLDIPEEDVRPELLAEAFATFAVPPDQYEPYLQESGIKLTSRLF